MTTANDELIKELCGTPVYQAPAKGRSLDHRGASISALGHTPLNPTRIRKAVSLDYTEGVRPLEHTLPSHPPTRRATYHEPHGPSPSPSPRVHRETHSGPPRSGRNEPAEVHGSAYAHQHANQPTHQSPRTSVQPHRRQSYHDLAPTPPRPIVRKAASYHGTRGRQTTAADGQQGGQPPVVCHRSHRSRGSMAAAQAQGRRVPRATSNQSYPGMQVVKEKAFYTVHASRRAEAEAQLMQCPEGGCGLAWTLRVHVLHFSVHR